MALNPGDKLGPYEIVEAIGQGGMGAVYRARDTRLGRDVAIKVSEQRFGERFEREARVISSLNHPNICHLYDVGDNYLVMELVEGQTLADRIKQGAIPLEESLNVARQIADALDAAHEKGVVHRDLKPGNVMVKEDGTVKVLDFGLAKAGPRAASSSDGDDPELSPTISMAATQAGVILGTASYMPPEQARGKTVDKRADIWSFGVVLCEMVTGQKLFKGEDLTETLAFVVTKDPDLSAAPMELRPLLEKCLEKDPKKRLRDISGVELLLDAGRREAELRVSAKAEAPIESRPAWQRRVWPAVAAVLAVVALAAGWIAWQASQPEDRPLVRLNVDLGDVALGPPGTPDVTISPDGTRIAYVAAPAGGTTPLLHTRRLDQEVATVLPGTEGAGNPFFSPDGQWIGFSQQTQLRKISVEGGAAVSLGQVQGALQALAGASWREGGYIVYSVPLGGGGLMRVSDGGGESEIISATPEGMLAYVQPQVLPDGKTVLVTTLGGPGQTAIEAVSMEGGERKTLVPGGAAGRYLPSGHLIYVNGGALFAVPFDLESLETRGTATPVLEGVATLPIGMAALAASRDGALIYRGGTSAGVLQSTVEWLDAAGRREPLIATPGGYGQVRLSPDQRRLALSVSEGPSIRISLYDIERGGFSPLTFEGANQYPIWTPDGRFVVFTVTGPFLFVRADGAGQPQTLLDGEVGRPFSFTPEGDRLAFGRIASLIDIETVPITSDGNMLQPGEPEPFLATSFVEDYPMFSPDGRWIAYQSNESGRNEIYVRAFPAPASGGGARFPVSVDGGTAPIWSRNRDELYFTSLDGNIMVADFQVNGENFVASRPRLWATLDGDLTGATFWDMSSDGHAVIVVPADTGEPGASGGPQHEVMFLENFFDYLRREVPVE